MAYPHKWSPRQLQVERRTAKAHRPKTDALPLDYATNHVGWRGFAEERGMLLIMIGGRHS